MTGASGFSFRSPVRMPTESLPKYAENSVYLALDRAFNGEAYQDWPPWSRMLRMASRAIQVLPDPVGAVTRQSDRPTASRARIWNGSGVKGRVSGVPISAKIRRSRRSAPGRMFRGIGFLRRRGLCRDVCFRYMNNDGVASRYSFAIMSAT